MKEIYKITICFKIRISINLRITAAIPIITPNRTDTAKIFNVTPRYYINIGIKSKINEGSNTFPML